MHFDRGSVRDVDAVEGEPRRLDERRHLTGEGPHHQRQDVAADHEHQECGDGPRPRRADRRLGCSMSSCTEFGRR
jgi:hypothetical protein